MSPAKEPREKPHVEVTEPSDPLDKYRKKRNPLTTSEPFSTERERSPGATRSGRFVVHLHAARQRHYDLRLQVVVPLAGGVQVNHEAPAARRSGTALPFS